MGVIKNDVGRPSNKSIMIRRILKLILLLVIVAGVFCAGYYIKDKEDANKKEDNKKFTTEKSTKGELKLTNKTVKKLYSYIDNVLFFKENKDGLVDDICTFYCENKNVKDFDNNFKMSLVLSSFDLQNINKIKVNDVKKVYYDIFGDKNLPDEFYNYNLEKLGDVKLNDKTYELLGKTPSIDPSYGTGYSLVKAINTGNSIELYVAQWYNNESDLMGEDVSKIDKPYEYYNTDACGDIKCDVIFKSNSYNDEKQIKENADKFTQYKFKFIKNKENNYNFTSVEKVK